MLFRDFADKFMEVSASYGNSPAELAQKRMCLTNHLLPYFGDCDMENLGTRETREYTEVKKQQGYATNTIAGHMGVFSRYLALAREERCLSALPFTVKKSRAEVAEAIYLDRAQREALLRAAAIEGGEVDAMIRFVLATGLRIGEVRALLRNSIDPQRKFVVVRASFDRVGKAVKSTKNGTIRSVPLSQAAIAALDSIPAHGQATIFTLDYHQARVAMGRVVEAAKIGKCGWHTLRHTFASVLLENHASIFEVSRLLGHKSIATTEKYAHLSLEAAAKAVALLPPL